MNAPSTSGTGGAGGAACMGGAAVEYRGVRFAYPGSTGPPALEQVTLTVSAGERLGILGPNGGGKSTLLKLTLGLLTPTAGEVLVDGLPPAEARRRGIVGYVPQRTETELAFPLSVRQVVTLAASWRLPAWRGVPAETAAHIERCLGLVGAAELAERPIGSLSGGQLQRVLIARALAARPRVLALDEPTVGIDPAGQRRFAELLTRVHGEFGVTILIVSHDLRAIVAGCDRVACLARRLHSHVSPEGLTPNVLAELFSHDIAGVLESVHVHAHPAAACADPSHEHGAPGHVHGPGCAHGEAPAAGVPRARP